MTIGATTSLEDLAYIVCSALHSAGETVVLSGGGAATVYAPKAYQSHDLDFVLVFNGRINAQPILNLGFLESNTRGIYAHSQTPFTVEFLDGPLAVGDEQVTSWLTLWKSEYLLNILSPTDCVRDRLSAAIHWRDVSSAKQAAAVARENPVDLDVIERWCRQEGGTRTFDLFLQLLAN